METPSRFERARTKIIATIGPACRTGQQMAELVRAGADVFRLNMAHATREAGGYLACEGCRPVSSAAVQRSPGKAGG
ncbi:MAG: pyruvate kinase [Pirellulales bacterium]